MSEPSEFPPYEPSAPLPAAQPPRPALPGRLVGRVTGAATRVEGHGRDFGSETVLSFRLLDPEGSGPVEVELRGRSISGTVRDGDWVEVDAAGRRTSGRLEVASVQNLTTSSTVGAPGSPTTPAARVLRVLIVLFFLAVLLAVVLGALQMFGVIDLGWFSGVQGDDGGTGFGGGYHLC